MKRLTKVVSLLVALMLLMSLSVVGLGQETFRIEDWEPYNADGTIKRTERDATGVNGVVSTGKFEASKVGVEIILAGGNAIDAAVAIGFALGVCEPQSSGLGGGGFMMIHSAEGETTFIDFREIAPAASTVEMWPVGEDGKVINNVKRMGGLSVGVPGEVKGLLYALETYGTMTREQVMNPAIKLAEEGYKVSAVMNRDMANSYEKLIKYPATAEIYLKEGFPYEVGDILKNPDLAKTLTLIRDNGESAFYTGPVAEAIVNSIQEDNGLITMEDLANYEIKMRDPIKATYRDDYEIITVAPPSTGGVHIIQILNILENFDVSSMEADSPEFLHLFAEATKLALADRAKYGGDTDFVDVPINGMISKEYCKTLAEKIDMTISQQYVEGNPWDYESEQTTSYSIIDKEGNMVAVTKTVNSVFASGVVAKGTGILMNNEMDDFSLGAEGVNAVEPGKKPLSSMSPTLVLKNGKPFMSLGAPGAVLIIPGVAMTITCVIDHGMDIQEAIDAPRILEGWGKVVLETRVPESVKEALEAMGHDIRYEEAWYSYPCVQGVCVMEDGTIRGGGDPRRDGKALGY
ncbi:MAG: gamma-glutamyltransferase [Christensenellales bacterium]|jgi:gamma-glutamyltranspeptidase/glutathione hydrolase